MCVCVCVCVCVFVCMHGCMHACVCVLKKFCSFYMAIVVGIASRCGLTVGACHRTVTVLKQVTQAKGQNISFIKVGVMYAYKEVKRKAGLYYR